MAILKDIINGLEVLGSTGPLDIEFGEIQFDSRKVQPGDMFVAVRGYQADGHDYIDTAISSGASVIVCEELPEEPADDITYLQLASTGRSLGLLASAYYDHPSARLRLIGVTGTNGKTSIATLLYELFEDLGYASGLLSTIRVMIHDREEPATHTTPDPVQIHRYMAAMAEAGCSHVFMEVSSHSIDQDRISGLAFEGGIFTNISHDHLDYHKTIDNYIAAKKKFFDKLPKGSFALVNTDDKRGRVMVQNTPADVRVYGLKSGEDYRARIIERSLEATYVDINGSELWIPFIGDFNIYNVLAVYGTALLLGEDKEEVLRVLSGSRPARGRFETIHSGDGKTAIVDYAHTPDALLNVLKAIRAIKPEGSSLITVAGAGGDRDRTKRPEMGKIAATYSERLIVSSDNPRTEDPASIIDEVVAGIPEEDMLKVISITDRREAIKAACMMAVAGDIILVAGKGHETYQDIMGVKHHFDDREELLAIFNKTKKKG